MPTVILDAGHGGSDFGAVYQGRREKDDNLALTLAVGDILAAAGIDVLYTRTTDIYETPTAKAQEGNVVVIDAIKMEAVKTKTFKTFLTAIGCDCKTLVVTAENDQIVVKSARNIPGVLVTFANLINVYDILNAKKFVVDQAALAKIEEVFA